MAHDDEMNPPVELVPMGENVPPDAKSDYGHTVVTLSREEIAHLAAGGALHFAVQDGEYTVEIRPA